MGNSCPSRHRALEVVVSLASSLLSAGTDVLEDEVFERVLSNWKRDQNVDVLKYGRQVELMRVAGDVDRRWRQLVLVRTLDRLKTSEIRSELHDIARENMARWQAGTSFADDAPAGRMRCVLWKRDWGEVTAELSREYGKTFAVLNQASTKYPGGLGGYIEGASGQEEDMFLRTDCHFSVERADLELEHYPVANIYDFSYTDTKRDLIGAKDGYVYLDKERPRVCICGGEVSATSRAGYEKLAKEDIFQFFELRSAAIQDMHMKRETLDALEEEEQKRRICAQLDTLKLHGLRYVVLTFPAYEPGSNLGKQVAEMYKDALLERARFFNIVAFAILRAGRSSTESWNDLNTVFADCDAGCGWDLVIRD